MLQLITCRRSEFIQLSLLGSRRRASLTVEAELMHAFKNTVIKSLVTITLFLFLPGVIRPQAPQPDGGGIRSQVRKGGLPPLLLLELDTVASKMSGGKPPFPTCDPAFIPGDPAMNLSRCHLN